MFRTVPLSFSRSFLLTACSKAVSKPVWHIPLLCVHWRTPAEGQRNCPKHIEFYSKNKFEKLVHLVGFIIRIYHDIRSPERQTLKCVCVCVWNSARIYCSKFCHLFNCYPVNQNLNWALDHPNIFFNLYN